MVLYWFIVIMFCIALIFAWFLVYFDKKSNDEFIVEQQKVEKTYLLDTQTHERISGSSAFARGLVGGAIGGDLGMIAGAASAKTKTSTTYTFLVYYKDGSRATKDCLKGGERWDFYISKLAID